MTYLPHASVPLTGVKMVAWERGQYYLGGKLSGFELPKRVFPCETPAQVRAKLPPNVDVVVFQCRNPVHRAHYELFTRSLGAANVGEGAVCLVHPTCGPTQVIGLECRQGNPPHPLSSLEWCAVPTSRSANIVRFHAH